MQRSFQAILTNIKKMNPLHIQTTATNRTIKQSIQALIKSECIEQAYKIPYIKQYTKNEQGKLITTNIQIIIIVPSKNREKSGTNILNNILKEREINTLNNI